MLPPCCLLPQAPDPVLRRWRVRIGASGMVLMVTIMTILPLVRPGMFD